MSQPQPTLTAKEAAAFVGLREGDIRDRKPGMPIKGLNGTEISVSKDGQTLTVTNTDRSGGRLAVEMRRLGPDAFEPVHAEYLPESGRKVMRTSVAEDMKHMAAAIGVRNSGAASGAADALGTALQRQNVLRSGQNASDWAFNAQVREFDRTRHLPMHFDTPPHMLGAKPEEVLKYHLRVSPQKGPDGSLTYTIPGDSAGKESLKVVAGADGSIKEVSLNGRTLPPTREIQQVVVSPATNYQRGGESMAQRVQSGLSNEFRHMGVLQKSEDIHSFLARQEQTHKTNLAAAAAAAPPKPAAPAPAAIHRPPVQLISLNSGATKFDKDCLERAQRLVQEIPPAVYKDPKQLAEYLQRMQPTHAPGMPGYGTVQHVGNLRVLEFANALTGSHPSESVSRVFGGVSHLGPHPSQVAAHIGGHKELLGHYVKDNIAQWVAKHPPHAPYVPPSHVKPVLAAAPHPAPHAPHMKGRLGGVLALAGLVTAMLSSPKDAAAAQLPAAPQPAEVQITGLAQLKDKLAEPATDKQTLRAAPVPPGRLRLD